MKKIKSGFTLAEVLITLAIIGIVAAIVMPAVITSYQYKTVGVKLSKFASTVENSARAYVVSNDSFAADTAAHKNDINNFLNESLIFKDILKPNGITAGQEYKTGLLGDIYKDASEIGIEGTKVTQSVDGQDVETSVNLIGVMKDNTKVQAVALNANDAAVNWAGANDDAMRMVDTHKVGEGMFKLVFDPAVTGLPKDAHKAFTFVVTELGYMYPAANDSCLWAIYSADWTTNSKMFVGDNAACSISAKNNNNG